MSTITVREDLIEHTETIYGWIKSCRKAIQLPICHELLENLVIRRFTPYVGKGITNFDLATAETKLIEAIREQELVVTQSKEKSLIENY